MRKSRLKKNILINLLLSIFCIFGDNILVLALKASQYPERVNYDLLQKNQYLIGPGDVLELSLFDAPEFSGLYKVLNDGRINLPLIGSILVNNLSLQEATDIIEGKFSKELIRPELFLSIKVSRPIKVSIIGEIERPGLYSLTNNELSNLEGVQQIVNSGLPTIVDAIQKAGGITQNADLKNITITRRMSGTESNFKQANLNLLDLIFNGDQNQNPYLFDGDIIKLNKAEDLPEDLIQIAKANLSPKIIKVSVIGKVQKPGNLTVDANTPLIQAILLAGGPIAWKADKGNVELIRINSNGTATKKKYKLNLSEGVSKDKNPPLKDNDIIFVNPSSLSKVSTALGAVAEPITPLVTGLSLLKLLQ